MPQTVNLTGGGAQLGQRLVKSVTFSAYASVDNQSAEVNPATAQYFVGHLFSGVNGGGTDFGRFSIDLREPIIAHGRANIQDALVDYFGYTGPDV